MSNLPTTPLNDNDSIPSSPFEQIKRVDPDGNEFWSARDLVHVLGYANWHKMNAVFNDVYSSFCLENSYQTEIVPASKRITIGSGANREVQDWHVSRTGLNRVLSRVAAHKPQAVRELRRNQVEFRIEIELGALLFDFCQYAELPIVFQYALENYLFDFCIADKLLIEVDEVSHKVQDQKRRDAKKDETAARNGFKLLRVKIPFDNAGKLCGAIFQLLTSSDDQNIQAEITADDRFQID
jgi:very-short-patch-repair endonuclease